MKKKETILYVLVWKDLENVLLNEKIEGAKKNGYNMLPVGGKNMLRRARAHTHTHTHTHTHYNDHRISLACLYLKLVKEVASGEQDWLVGEIGVGRRLTFQFRHFHTFYILYLIVWLCTKNN